MKEQARPEALMRARIMGIKSSNCGNCNYFLYTNRAWCGKHTFSPPARTSVEYICKDYEPKARTPQS